MWLYLLALAIIGVIILLLIGRWDGAAAPEEESGAAPNDDVGRLLAELREDPEGPGRITAEHLEQVSFDSGFRGYRMDQVDALLDALAEQLRGNDSQQIRLPEEGTRDTP